MNAKSWCENMEKSLPEWNDVNALADAMQLCNCPSDAATQSSEVKTSSLAAPTYFDALMEANRRRFEQKDSTPDAPTP